MGINFLFASIEVAGTFLLTGPEGSSYEVCASVACRLDIISAGRIIIASAYNL